MPRVIDFSYFQVRRCKNADLGTRGCLLYPKTTEAQTSAPRHSYTLPRLAMCSHSMFSFGGGKICKVKSDIFKRKTPTYFRINLRPHKTWMRPWRPSYPVHILQIFFYEGKNIKKILNITNMFRTCFYLLIIYETAFFNSCLQHF